jgi:hypothetical protein
MAETMNPAGRRERFPREPAAGGEAPTGAAELSISTVPAAGKMAGPPAIAVIEAGERDRPATVTSASSPGQDRGSGPAILRRIRAATEAETAAVPVASADVIGAELAGIMSHRPRREVPGQRRWSRSLPVRPPWSDPGDYEPTAAADLSISLVPR